MFWGIDTAEEWLLVVAELLVITTVMLLATVLAVMIVGVYLFKALWHWDIHYVIEK